MGKTHLVLRSLAPFSLVVLSSRLHVGMHTKTETKNISQLLDLLSTILETAKVAEVLSNSPDGLLSINVLVVPIDQFMSSFQILSDGFLGKHVFACRQGFLDEIGLNENG